MERNPEHSHPAQPEQPDHGFAEGVETPPHDERESDFARGVREGPEIELEHKGRFSEGQEELPDSPEKLREGDFATGVEGVPPQERTD
jgi:hypothetical protein